MKVFASDYDGTLYKNQEITDYDLEMIHKFREEGNLFGIATGRPINSIRFEMEKYNIPYDFLVGINGGVVLSAEHDELYASSFNKDVLPELMQTLIDEKVLYYGINDGYGVSRVYVEQSFPNYEMNIELSELETMLSNGVKSLYVSHMSEKHAFELANLINEMYAENGIHSFQNFESVDIGAVNVSKSTGILTVLDHYKLNGTTKIFTAGDANNDAPMIRDFYGFAMDTGVDLIKDTSKEVVTSVGEALARAIIL